MGQKVDAKEPGALNSPGRLRKIDQLREKNIGKYLPLPQLVAVGDQSSGKSSLLESLTKIPFPRGQELCTRYATQISSRRDDHQQIYISIIPAPSAPPADKERLEAYSVQLESTAQLYEKFSVILDEVNTHMGIRTAKNPTGSKTFSQDVLKIEKCGPEEDCLTVIDVPGIFRTTDEVTTAKDRHLVKNMVKDYIKDARTIILAVLPSNVDVATQEILSLAEDYDKTGERTIGVLTKPDLLTERSAKLAVCNLIEGKRKPLKLGYYVVRNRGGDDDEEHSSQKAREDMFQGDPWRSLSQARLGIDALRDSLRDLLGQITDRAFPKLRAETRQMLTASREELENIGPPRQTEREQQQYLAAMASKFQGLVRSSLTADYSSHQEFAVHELRLITAVVNITERFDASFMHGAHAYHFESKKAFSNKTDEAEDEETRSKSQGWTLGSSNDFSKSLPDKYPDLDRIIVNDWSSPKPTVGIVDWIKGLHRRSRGLELGTFGTGLLSTAFQEQSARWALMTKQYLSRIILTIHMFIMGAFEEICKDTRVREELTSTLMSGLIGKYDAAMGHAMFLVDVEREKKPYTLNHYFNSNLQKRRGDRLRETLRRKARQERGDYEKIVIDLDSIPSAVSDKSNAEHAVEDIHDTLEAYYKVARKRFVDNVYHQAVDHSLLSGPMSPLTMFTEQWVLQLDTEKLDAIAGESRFTRNRRERLANTIKDMEEAIEILR